MREIRLELETALMDLPDLTEKMLDELKYSVGEENVDLDQVNFIYYWDFVSNYKEDLDNTSDVGREKMLFEERLNHEISKIAIEFYINYHSYIRGEKLPSGYLPSLVYDIFERMVASNMRYEYTIYNYADVYESIPKDIESIEELEEYYKKQEVLNKIIREQEDSMENDIEENIIEDKYNIDDILDKISKYGMESLTNEELNYLNNNN